MTKDLNNSWDQLTETLEASTDLLFEVDEAGNYLLVHAINEKLLAAAKENLLGKNVMDVLPADAAATVIEALKEACLNGSDYGRAIRLPLEHGANWFELSVAKKNSTAGEAPHFIVLSRDITERKRSEEELYRLNRSLRAISSCNLTLSHSLDEAELLNEVCCIISEIGGYRLVWVGIAEQDSAKRVRPLFHAGFDDGYLETLDISWADAERGRGPVGTAIRTGLPCLVTDIRTDPDFALWRQDALLRGFRSVLALPLIIDGQVPLALCIYSDSHNCIDTEEMKLLTALADNLAYGIAMVRTRISREQAEHELQTSEKRLRCITDSALDAIVMMDPRGAITYWNPAAERILGYRLDEALGKDLHDLFVPGCYHGDFHAAFPEFLNTGNGKAIGISRDVFARRKDGQEVAVAVSLSSVVLNGENHSVGIIHDVTERKKHEYELERACDAAEAASRAKSEFLSTMSHEIRTPLNAILGMGDLLSEGPLNEEQAEYLKVVSSAGETLLYLVDNVLDLSKIEAGKLQLESTTFHLAECIEHLTSILSLKASVKGVTFSSTVEADVPDRLGGDAQRLQQVLINLVGNAIKFTESGGNVILRVESEHFSDTEIRVNFSVTDTGIGIPVDKLDLVFENFSQADSSTTRKYGGTGLGLAISKRLVAMMGGILSVTSTPGTGSCFRFGARFTVPAESAALRTQEQPEAEKRNRAMSILIVDDNKDNRVVLAAYFRRTDHAIDSAVNGAEAVEKIKQGGYDLVLLDMEMPVMDGYTAARTVREWERETGRPPLPLVALTANALKEDLQRSLAAGCTAHLAKPIDKGKLLEAIEAYM